MPQAFHSSSALGIQFSFFSIPLPSIHTLSLVASSAQHSKCSMCVYWMGESKWLWHPLIVMKASFFLGLSLLGKRSSWQPSSPPPSILFLLNNHVEGFPPSPWGNQAAADAFSPPPEIYERHNDDSSSMNIWRDVRAAGAFMGSVNIHQWDNFQITALDKYISIPGLL